MAKFILVVLTMLVSRVSLAADDSRQIPLDPYIFFSTSSWFLLPAAEDAALRKGDHTAAIFRRYAVLGAKDDWRARKGSDEPLKAVQGAPFVNILNFHCKEPGYNNHVTLHIPNWATLKGVNHEDWLNELPSRVLVDGTTSTALVGEFLKGDYFVDVDGGNDDAIRQILNGTQLTFALSSRDKIEVFATDNPGSTNLMGFFGDLLVQQFALPAAPIAVTTDEMLQLCETRFRAPQ